MDDNHFDSDGDLPKFPSELRIWLYVIAIGTFGALQQFCLIGKQYQKFLCFALNTRATSLYCAALKSS